MASKKKSLASTRLRKVVLPGKEAFGKIVADVGKKSNPQEISDLVLGPFYEIMEQTKRGLG